MDDATAAEEGARLLPLSTVAEDTGPACEESCRSATVPTASGKESGGDDDDEKDDWLTGVLPWRNTRGAPTMRGGAAHLADTYEFAYEFGDDVDSASSEEV